MSMRQLKITKSITNRESQSLEKYLQEIGKVELISPDLWPVLKEKGLTCAIASSHGLSNAPVLDGIELGHARSVRG